MTSFHIEINLYKEEAKALVSDGMSQYIYTDMAPELHIKIDLSIQENTHPINNFNTGNSIKQQEVQQIGQELVSLSYKETFLE